MAKATQSVQAAKEAQSLRSMKFNRFLWFRYATAGMFFVNLYWMILLAGSGSQAFVLPAVLLVTNIAVTVEQTLKYWNAGHSLPVTKLGYLIQLLANIAVLIAVAAGAAPVLFPFFASTKQIAILWMLTFGILLCLWVERRAWLVEHDQDKYLARLQVFAGSLH